MTIQHSKERFKKYYPKHFIFKIKDKYIIIGKRKTPTKIKNAYIIKVIKDGIPMHINLTWGITDTIKGIYKAIIYKT